MPGLTPDQALQMASQLYARGDLAAAASICRRILQQDSRCVPALQVLALIIHQTGESEAALQLLQQAIELAPGNAEAQCNLGVVYQSLSRIDEAIGVYQRAIALNPQFASAYDNLGLALKEKGQFESAIACFRKALVLRPDDADIQNNLGAALVEVDQLDPAIDCFHHALAIKPNHVHALVNLGNTQKDQGQIEEAIASYRRALALRPDFVTAHHALLYALHFHPDYDAKAIYQEHLLFQERHERPLLSSIRPHANERSPNRRLRIGYLSPDLRNHPVGLFLLPLLSSHDHQQFEIFCYAATHHPADAITQALMRHADHWENITALDDEKAADRIRQDRIDILVDLAMHLADNRLLLFARKPAPIQVTYLAYCSTTGMKSIDYRFTDPYLDPPGANDEYYSEKSIHLGSYWCYHTHGPTIEIGPLPALSRGTINFGCLNNFGKVTPRALLAWCQLLQSVPHSRLTLHAAEGSHRQQTYDLLAREGVDPTRLTFVPRLARSEYFELYNRIDIALDPFPYGGGTTSCDALWMGVPLVSLSGRTAVGRSGVSILSQIGLTELIGANQDEYVRIAADLAGDLEKLAQLRMSLRERMRRSPLMDAARFARNVEAAYRTIWTDWWQSGNP